MTPGHGISHRPHELPDAPATSLAHTGATLGKARSENFPVAPVFLPRAWREGLMAVYGYARLVDDIGDGDLAPGGRDAVLLGLDPAAADDRPAMLDALEADLRRVFGGTDGPPRHPLMLALQPVVRAHALTPEPFLALIGANRQDQRVARYETYGDLLGYCELSANPVGRLVLQLTGTSTPSGSAAPTPSAPPCRSSNTSRTSPRTSAGTGSTCRPRTCAGST